MSVPRSPRRSHAPRRAAGYSLVALMAACAITLILLTAAAPTWRYLSQNDKEEELLFRGGEIADAIGRYQRRNGNALPASMDVLVKGRFLRRAYKDPMTKDGKWRLVRPGEVVGATSPGAVQTGAGVAGITTTTTTTMRPSAFSQPATFGVFQGVASTSKEKSLRVFNGRRRYDEWVFLPGQPRVVGRPIGSPFGTGGPAGGPALARPIAPLSPQGGTLGSPGSPGQPYVVPP